MVEDSSLANAISVSLVVGQAGLWNLTQKIMNCLMLLLWFLLVPSAYIMAWDSLAFSSRAENRSSAASFTSWLVGGDVVGCGTGEEVVGLAALLAERHWFWLTLPLCHP